jgi:hypothetical protein
MDKKENKMTDEVKPEKEKKEFGKFDRWEIESAVRTIIEAEQIKLDKEKMKYVLPMLEEQKKALDKASSAAEVLYGKQDTQK